MKYEYLTYLISFAAMQAQKTIAFSSSNQPPTNLWPKAKAMTLHL